MSSKPRIPWRYAVGGAIDLCGLAGLALGVWGPAVSQALLIALTLLVTTMVGYCAKATLDSSFED